MVRTSRCFARLLSQFDGPDALVAVRRYLCDLHLADFSFARVTHCPLTIFFSTGRAKKMEHPYEVIGGGPPIRRFGDQRARELRVRSLARAQIFQAIFESEPQARSSRGEVVTHCVAAV
jgi:protoheme ferro-lyase